MDRPRLIPQRRYFHRLAAGGALALALLGSPACGHVPQASPAVAGDGMAPLCLVAPPDFGFCPTAPQDAGDRYTVLFALLSQQASVEVVGIGSRQAKRIADGRKGVLAVVSLRAGSAMLDMQVNNGDLERTSLRRGDRMELRGQPAGLMLFKGAVSLAVIPSPALMTLSGHAVHAPSSATLE